MPSGASTQRRVYHIPFAARHLNVYAPNQLYPDLGLRWSDEEWFRHLGMVQAFGFNVFQMALEPALLGPDAHRAGPGAAFRRQMAAVTAHARSLGMETCLLAPLAEVDGRAVCPNDPAEWELIQATWRTWLGLLPDVTIVGISPGSGAGCTRNGCTARTFVDRSIELAGLVTSVLPRAAIEIHTWGPPFLGWGRSGWDPDPARAEDALGHLAGRLGEMPAGTTVAINLGLNPAGDPEPATRRWAQELGRTARLVTWDAALGGVDEPPLPRYGMERLVERRRAEAAAGYSGGVHVTTTPLLNQAASYAAARSFLTPEDSPSEPARAFLQGVFGTQGRAVADGLALFDNVAEVRPRGAVRKDMGQLLELLSTLRARPHGPFHPEPEDWRKELAFFARLGRDLCDKTPDYDELHRRYWYHVYRIHDRMNPGPHPHPARMADALIQRFRSLPD